MKFNISFREFCCLISSLFRLESEEESELLETINGDCSEAKIRVDANHLEMVNKNIFTYPRHYKADQKFRKGVGDYISRRFGSLGLITGFQQFSPSQFHNLVINLADGEGLNPPLLLPWVYLTFINYHYLKHILQQQRKG